MGIAIPSYGNPGFVYNEDEYNLTWGQTFDVDSLSRNSKLVDGPQEVVIICPHKNGRVSGLLNGGVTLNGHAEWTEMMGGGIMSLGGTIVETGNNLMQFTRGTSIQQPWMNRKMWKTTKPFSFNIPMNFVAMTDSVNDVVRPAMALMSFIYPRELSTDSGDTSTGYTNLPDNVKNVFDASGLAGSALNSFTLYNIPGPGIRYNGKDDGDQIGDPVSIVIGKMFAFGSCYLEDVNLEFSQAVDSNGYPIACKASVKATVMDSGTCDTDGNFLIQEFSNSSERLNTFIDSFSQTAEQLISDLKNIIKKTIGFYKGNTKE